MIAAFRWDLVLVAVVAATPPTIAALLNRRQGKATHDLVEAEVNPNHGTSMRDSLDRIEQRQANQAGEFTAHILADAEWKKRHEEQHID